MSETERATVAELVSATKALLVAFDFAIVRGQISAGTENNAIANAAAVALERAKERGL